MLATIRKDYLLFLLLLLQILFWTHTRHIKPDMHVIPRVPSELEVKATSFGDEQFYFRTLAFEIQNAGDTFGRVTPLKDYDYRDLQRWFSLLDSLDAVSNQVPAMAAYYYSNTQYKPDVRYVVDYLDAHADKDPAKKWWWYHQAIYHAKHILKDKERALEIAYKLSAVPGDLPLWARQMPAFILEDLGQYEEALIIIKDILDNHEDLGQGELNFMNYFINERLETIKGLDEKGE